MSSVKTIKIDEVEYVRKDSITNMLPVLDDKNYSIIRTVNAGVHAGYLHSTDLSNSSVVLKNSRRIWYWEGAASLSQLALEGVKKPKSCKFSVVVPEITLLGVIEIIPCTTLAVQNISEVEIWRV